MAAQRCSLCNVNYPLGYMTCQVCGDALDRTNVAIDDDWQKKVRHALEHPVATESDRVLVWRLDQLLRMSFDVETAERLAASDAELRFIETRLLGRGCTLELAARIA